MCTLSNTTSTKYSKITSHFKGNVTITNTSISKAYNCVRLPFFLTILVHAVYRQCYICSLSLASVKSRLVLPFWYRLIRVVPEKGPLNGCVCVLHMPRCVNDMQQWFPNSVQVSMAIPFQDFRKMWRAVWALSPPGHLAIVTSICNCNTPTM